MRKHLEEDVSMNRYAQMIRELQSAPVVERLNTLYGSRDGMIVKQIARYTSMIKRHEEIFHETEKDVLMISAPGRTEIGGNHTDHNKGLVLAAAVNLDTLAAVSARDDMQVHCYSEGYAPIVVDLSDLSVHPEEEGTTAALIRGVASKMAQLGYKVGGFNAAMTSSVRSGSGLSSSASFEVLVCAILDKLYNGFVIDFKTRAIISQYAENVYFGKPSGLLDQMASSAGGLVHVDFRNDDPAVTPMQFDFAAAGYALVVVATGGSHADLTDEYAAIPREMKQVAAVFGCENLRQVRGDELWHSLGSVRQKTSDRAVLRTFHFLSENDRVKQQVKALKNNDIKDFFDAIIASGRSSFMFLQNVYPAGSSDMSLAVALSMAEYKLAGKGAWRIHGGGFAGTTLNFVPQDMLAEYVGDMEEVFGKGCCTVLDIRPEGAAVVDLNK